MDLKKATQKVEKAYQHRKHLLDTRLLTRLHIKKSHLFLIILSLIFLIFNKEYTLFIILTFLSTIFSFFHSKYNRTPVDMKFSLVIGLFITRHYGIPALIFFFIISDIIPALLGGESLNGPDIFFIAWYFIINSVVLIFPEVSLTVLGPILVIVEATGSIFINSTIGGIPGFLSVWVSILVILVRIIYLLTIGRVLEFIFRFI